MGQFRRPPGFSTSTEHSPGRAQTAEARSPTSSSSRLTSRSPELSRCWRLESSFQHVVSERITSHRRPFKASTSLPSMALTRHDSAPIIVTSCSWALAANEAL